MIHMLIKFDRTEQIIRFAGTISKYNSDADIRYGSVLVDAKSIMGVMALAIARTVKLIVHSTEGSCPGPAEKMAGFAA